MFELRSSRFASGGHSIRAWRTLARVSDRSRGLWTAFLPSSCYLYHTFV